MKTDITLQQEQQLLPRYRYLENQMMELMGGWVQTIEDAAVKVAFGRQLYDEALHSDRLKRRLPELKVRVEERQEIMPSDAFAKLIEVIWHLEGDVPRLVVLYRVLKPHFIEALEAHRKAVLPADEPTARLLEEILCQERSHVQWGERTLERLAAENAGASVEHDLREQLEASGGVACLDAPAAQYTFSKTFGCSKQPVRDARWAVVEGPEAYAEKSWTFATQEGKQHLLNDLLNSEYITVERLGQILAEFPELPWAMRVDLARQVWDEARHAEVIEERLLEVGGHTGMYPANFWGWEVDMNWPDPLERLALSNATFERESCKHLRTWIREAKSHGDRASARVLEYVLADEVTHVHFGQKWIMALTEDDSARQERVLDYPKRLLDEMHPVGTRFDEVAFGL